MGQREEEPTHALPTQLVAKLVEAKDWYDEQERLDTTIRTYGGIAQRNQEDRDEIARQAAPILEAIVEIIDETWGFAK
jgi:hypothetical protein